MSPKKYILLLPLAWIYKLIIRGRNLLFDWKLLPSKSFDFPVICIGNLTVGGTGKTPHTEYLIRLLHSKFRLGVLSRGYRRKSKGYVLANSMTPLSEVGDEPWQMKNKFPQVKIAVCAKRVEGIERLMDVSEEEQPQAVLLDDAYQHRYVKAGLNILLTSYQRPMYSDWLLPAGRLREPFSARKRAQIIVMTKCPVSMTNSEMELIRQRLNPTAEQSVFFTSLQYDNLYGLFNQRSLELGELKDFSEVGLLTGIAAPEPLENDLQRKGIHVRGLYFPDHHDFSRDDVRLMKEKFVDNRPVEVIVTTEKDAARLRFCDYLDEYIRQKLFVIPLRIMFLGEGEKQFDKIIMNYVTENTRNS